MIVQYAIAGLIALLGLNLLIAAWCWCYASWWDRKRRRHARRHGGTLQFLPGRRR